MSTTKAPATQLSRLNHPASALAVYASQAGSPRHHARLASGCWPNSSGRAWLPAGFHRKVSRCILHLSLLSQVLRSARTQYRIMETLHELLGIVSPEPERYPRVSRYHHLSFDAQQRKLVHEPDLEKKVKAELLDGGYLLRSDREDLDAEEAWLMYMTLTRAEAAVA